MSSTQPAAATLKDAPPALRETPIDESETHSGDLIFGEGQLILADGVIVQTHFVQLKEAPVFKWPQELPASHPRLSRGACNREWGTSPAEQA